MRRSTKTVALPILLLLIIAVSSAVVIGISNAQSQQVAVPEAPRLIAHAGGDIYGVRMTNSRQALDRSYEEGFRLIEVDICTTSDNIPVLGHDWGNANWFSGVNYSTEVPAYDEFMARQPILDLDMLDLASLAEWLAEHENAYIVTDIKEDNIEILRHIAKEYPGVSKRFIPQIYSFSEYDAVKALGYSNIILTEYRLKAEDQEILEFCQKNPLFALTLSQTRATPEMLAKCKEIGIPTYVHTINDYNVYIKLRDSGAHGVYTDYFQPSDWVE
jgi:glycerophosphoryl diester phosphodiesterase